MSKENDFSCGGCLGGIIIIGLIGQILGYIIDGVKWAFEWCSDVFSDVSAYTHAHEAEIAGILLCLVKAAVCAGIIVALVGGGLVATMNFIISLRHLKNRPTHNWSARSREASAFPAYYYWKGDWIINLREIIKENYHCNKASMKNYIEHVKEAWSGKTPGKRALLLIPYLLPVTLGALLRILMLVVGFLLFMPLVALPVLAGGLTLVLGAHLLAGGTWLVETLHDLCMGIKVICPECGKHIGLPSYFCSKCGKKHTRLFPSPVYGIFSHTCHCGEKLPTSRFLGRLKLEAICPGCNRKLLPDSEKAAAHFIALVGGPGAGKTSVLASLLQHLTFWQHENQECSISYPDNGQVAYNLVSMWHSNTLSATRAATVYSVEVKGAKTLTPRRVYMHDTGGRDFESMQDILLHSCYRKLSGVIFVIDPFTLPHINSVLKESNPGILEDYRVESCHVDDILAQWMLAMNTGHRGGTKTIDCAFVLTKASEPILNQFGKISPGCDDATCRAFLGALGLHSLLAQEDAFKSVRYFAVNTPPQSGRVSPGMQQLSKWVLSKIGFLK